MANDSWFCRFTKQFPLQFPIMLSKFSALTFALALLLTQGAIVSGAPLTNGRRSFLGSCATGSLTIICVGRQDLEASKRIGLSNYEPLRLESI